MSHYATMGCGFDNEDYLVVYLKHVCEAMTFDNFTMFVFTSVSVPDDDKTPPVTASPHLIQREQSTNDKTAKD